MEQDDALNNQKFSWDAYSLAILALFAFLQVLHWNMFPKFLDTYYHLSVMTGFADAGGYVTRAFWEYAPIGRPHLYPPLIHVLMLILFKLGFSKLFIARFFSCFIYPAMLIAAWQTIRIIFNERLAFFVLLVCSSISGFYISVVNLIPFSLCLIFGLLILLCIHKQKIIAAGLIMALSFYTHTQASWLVLFWVLLYGVFNKSHFKHSIKTASIGLLFAAPILFHQFYNRRYFEFIDAMENYLLDFNILVYLAAVLGIALAIKRRGSYYFFISILAGTLPLFFTHKMRYFSGIGLIGFVFLAGLGLDFIYEKMALKRKKSLIILLLIAIILSFFVFSPSMYIDRNISQARFGLFDNTLVNVLKGSKRQFYSTELSIYYPRFQDEVFRAITENSKDDDIIWSDLSYFAGLVSVFSHRATSTAMLFEIKPYAYFDQIKAAKLIVLLKDTKQLFPAAFADLIAGYDLSLVKKTEIAYIYQNPHAQSKLNIPRPLIPIPLLFCLFFIYIGFVSYSIIRG